MCTVITLWSCKEAMELWLILKNPPHISQSIRRGTAALRLPSALTLLTVGPRFSLSPFAFPQSSSAPKTPTYFFFTPPPLPPPSLFSSSSLVYRFFFLNSSSRRSAASPSLPKTPSAARSRSALLAPGHFCVRPRLFD